LDNRFAKLSSCIFQGAIVLCRVIMYALESDVLFLLHLYHACNLLRDLNKTHIASALSNKVSTSLGLLIDSTQISSLHNQALRLYVTTSCQPGLASLLQHVGNDAVTIPWDYSHGHAEKSFYFVSVSVYVVV
jgi:hypothetical protein